MIKKILKDFAMHIRLSNRNLAKKLLFTIYFYFYSVMCVNLSTTNPATPHTPTYTYTSTYNQTTSE